MIGKDVPATLSNPIEGNDYPPQEAPVFYCTETDCEWIGNNPKETPDGIVYCPECGGTLEYAVRCRHCFEWFRDDEIHDGSCPECYVEWKAGPEVNPVFHSILNALRNGPGFFGGGK